VCPKRSLCIIWNDRNQGLVGKLGTNLVYPSSFRYCAPDLVS
jgi:hypothetical protein